MQKVKLGSYHRQFWVMKLAQIMVVSPYQAKWQIPKLILKALKVGFNAWNYISIFLMLLIHFESYME